MSQSNQAKEPIFKKKPAIAGLDIGTTKVAFVIGVEGPEGLEIVGVGTTPNLGMRQGVVVNIEAATEAIQKARDEAELMAGLKADKVWLSVGGSHIESFNSDGMVAIRNQEVREDDIGRVIEAAKAVAIPNDRQVLHVLPNEYAIDGQDGIRDPIGMSGVRLECKVHIVTGNHSAIQNAYKCAENAGLKVQGLVLEQLASSLSVLTADEKNLGVTLVDIGGGTCDLITFQQGSVVHTGVIPVGGQNFTHDVAMGLRTTQTSAEELKRNYGCAISEMVTEEEVIEVESVGGRKERSIHRRELCHVLEARADETLKLIKVELEKSGYGNKLGSGLVITGGASQLAGLAEMGDFVFDIPVRFGMPARLGGLTDVVRSSQYATAVGLLKYGLERNQPRTSLKEQQESINEKMGEWGRRIKDWISGPTT